MQTTQINQIACIGEVMIELFADGPDHAVVGVAGDTYNTAVYLKKLSQDRDTKISYVTALGEDKFSDRIIEKMLHYGLDTSCVERFPDAMPGLYAIDIDDQGERSFSYWRSQAAARSMLSGSSKIQPNHLSGFELIYLSGITMAILPPETRNSLIEFLKQYRSNGGKFAFDSNYRPKLWEDKETAQKITMEMWALADIALPSIDDEMFLFDETTQQQTVERLHNAGVKFGALKRGAEGPLSLGESVINTEYASVANIVDTTAAGDSFNAGFLAAIANAQNIQTALQAGHNLASKVIQAKGAIIDLDMI